jgi:hypothetical protein
LNQFALRYDPHGLSMVGGIATAAQIRSRHFAPLEYFLLRRSYLSGMFVQK